MNLLRELRAEEVPVLIERALPRPSNRYAKSCSMTGSTFLKGNVAFLSDFARPVEPPFLTVLRPTEEPMTVSRFAEAGAAKVPQPGGEGVPRTVFGWVDKRSIEFRNQR